MQDILKLLATTADIDVEPEVIDGAMCDLAMDDIGLVYGGGPSSGGCSPTRDACCRPIDSCD